MNTVSPVGIGYFADRYGPKMTNVLGSVLFSISATMFVVSLLYNVDMILVAFAIMAGSGPAISLSVFHFSNLFPGYELTVMSAFSGIFTVSSLVFPMFEVLAHHGVHLGYSFGGFVLLLLPIYLIGYYVFPFTTFEHSHEGDTEQLIGVVDQGEANERLRVKKGSFKEQIKTKDYWLVIGFLAVQSLRVSMYIGTLNDRFPKDSIYLKAFPYMWPGGVIFIPLIGWMLDRIGHAFAYTVLLIVSVLYCIIDLIHIDGLQFITFVLISYGNVANWGMLFSYISWRFGFANYGKLLGGCSVTVAVFGLLQYLFVFVTVHSLNDHYFFVNVLMLCMNAPLLYVPYYLKKNV